MNTSLSRVMLITVATVGCMRADFDNAGRDMLPGRPAVRVASHTEVKRAALEFKKSLTRLVQVYMKHFDKEMTKTQKADVAQFFDLLNQLLERVEKVSRMKKVSPKLQQELNTLNDALSTYFTLFFMAVMQELATSPDSEKTFKNVFKEIDEVVAVACKALG